MIRQDEQPVGPRRRRSPSAAAMFAGNLMLALAWVAMTGRFDVESLLVGFIFGYLVLFVSSRLVGPSTYFSKSRLLLGFTAFYIVELVRSNLRVAWDVITPERRSGRGIVAVPLDATTDAEITVLASLLSMTPGSLSIDVSNDRRFLYVHTMFLEDPEAFRASVKDDFERRVLELMR